MNNFISPFDINTNLIYIQNKLAKKVITGDEDEIPEIITGVDVSFSKNNKAVAAAVSVDLETLKITEKITQEKELCFPYIPGLLGFREADAMVSVLKGLKEGFDVAMINGHGVLHPRSFGLASQVGLLTDKPAIGVAKSLTSGKYTVQDLSFNTKLSGAKPVVHGDEIIGAYMNGNYISVGHKISLERAVKIVENSSIYNTPEPLRQAHMLATEVFKNLLKN